MPSEAEIRIRLAEPVDLGVVGALTEMAYEPYTKAWGASPLPMTEDYGPHIRNGGIWTP